MAALCVDVTVLLHFVALMNALAEETKKLVRLQAVDLGTSPSYGGVEGFAEANLRRLKAQLESRAEAGCRRRRRPEARRTFARRPGA